MNPGEQFAKYQKPHAEMLRVESQKGWFLTSLIYAQAAVVDAGASAEEINGMNRLIETLTQLAADKPEFKRLPVKVLAVLDRTGGKPAESEEKKS